MARIEMHRENIFSVNTVVMELIIEKTNDLKFYVIFLLQGNII